MQNPGHIEFGQKELKRQGIEKKERNKMSEFKSAISYPFALPHLFAVQTLLLICRF